MRCAGVFGCAFFFGGSRNVTLQLISGFRNLSLFTIEDTNRRTIAALESGTPPDIVKRLNDATVEAMKTPGVRERLEALGAVIVPQDRATPEYLGQFLKSEIDKWAGPIKASGVTVD